MSITPSVHLPYFLLYVYPWGLSCQLTQIQDMHIAEAFMAIATAKHDQFVLDEIGGMIATRNGGRAGRLDLRPPRTHRIRDIKHMYVGERACTVTTTNDDDLVIPETGGMRTTRRGWYAFGDGLRPCQGIYGATKERDKHTRHGWADRLLLPLTCMQHVEVIKVIGTVATTKHVQVVGPLARAEIPFDQRTRMRTAGRWWLSECPRLRPRHGIYYKKKLIKENVQ